MMNDLAIRFEHSAAAYDHLRSLSVDELRGELSRALTITAKTVSYLAMVWRELESRGEDLSDLRVGIGAYLPQIAAGHLAAEAVVSFAGRKAVLDGVAALPIEKQIAIASGERVTVMVQTGSGLVEKEMPATALSAEQAKLVFDDGRIRSSREQKKILEDAGSIARKKSAVTFFVSDEEKAIIREAAAKAGVSVPALVKLALREYVEGPLHGRDA